MLSPPVLFQTFSFILQVHQITLETISKHTKNPGPDGWQVEQEPAMHTCGKESQQHPGLH